MAKKKRKRRSHSGPPSTPKGGASDRAARKEAARRERERAIRAYRRRRRLIRGGVIAAILAVAGGAAFLIWQNTQQAAERRERADALAAEVGCGEMEEADGPDGQQFPHVEQPPQYETVPASYGPHAGQILPPEVSVYDQPFDPAFEFRAVHNLEHGYVIMYHRPQEESALDEEIVSSLADLAEGEEKVVLAPHPNLPQDEELVLVAWNRIRRCTGEPEDPDGVRQLALAFIEEFREGPAAPEPQAP